MEKIIVPTDFSPTSGSALRYAYFLAEATGLGVEVIHVHDGYGHGKSRRAKSDGLGTRRNAQRKLDEFIRFHLRTVHTVASLDDADEEHEVNISSQTIIGTPTASLIAASRRANTCLTIMGGVGSGVVRTLTPFFGSIARKVAERAACPVLLVPKGYGEPILKRASIAFNWIGALRETSNGFDFLRIALGPTMRLVHVRNIRKKAETQKKTDLLEEVLNTEFPSYPAELDLLEPGVTATRLLSYAHDEEIDLLVMSRRNRSLFDRLFIRSEISSVLEYVATPMLVIPISHN